MENIKNFDEFTEENSGVVKNLIFEGIVPNFVKKTVKLTMDNNFGVDFSEKKYLKYKRNGLTVYSIFKRTELPGYGSKTRNDDGNPFIWALKQIDGWSFDFSDDDAKKYIRRFLEVCHSIDKKYDVIVMAPSKNKVNERFMDIIYGIVGADKKIKDYFLKVETSDIMYNLDTELINKDFSNEYSKEALEKEMLRKLRTMGKFFEAKKFNKDYLKYIKSIVTVSGDYSVSDSSKLFKDKNVLVLDDVFASGKTVSDCVKCINDFEPKKVDVITLLSARFKK